MILITVDDLVDYKILPFNIYDENGQMTMSSGEILTPGKLLQLRYLNAIYREETPEETEETEESKDINTDETEAGSSESKLSSSANSLGEKSVEVYSEQITGDGFSPEIVKNTLEDPFENAVNYKSTIGEQTQLQLKSLYSKAIISLKENITDNNIKQIKYIRDKILDEVLPIIGKTYRKSQLKIIGDYNKYHGLNVSLLATMLAKKLGLSDAQTAEVVMAALLHDIGKSKLPKDVQESNVLSSQTNRLFQLHTQLGYKILKNDMNLSENVCRVALEHHEKNDGGGYPYGISGELIGQYSQIVSICNVYENLISGRTNISVSTTQEAVKSILEMGTAFFSPEILFSFVYMTNYFDSTPIEQLGILVDNKWKE